MKQAVVIGAGPAGLMAAEMLADQGHGVLVIDAKPSVGRKLLMAGKSGLNLTMDQPFEPFLAAYNEAADWLRPMLTSFSNKDVVTWANGLGQDVFTGSTKRIFPKAMKASPLLRAWLVRLQTKGVRFQTRWRWVGWQDGDLAFETASGATVLDADATVLALGGASWARLGSNGKWAEILSRKGVAITPFQAANIGFSVDWSTHMARHFGKPVKGCALYAGEIRNRGEFIISFKGLEGGGIYAVSRAMRSGAALSLDLLPDQSQTAIVGKLGRPRGKASLSNHLRKTLKLDPVSISLLQEFARPLPTDTTALARTIKCLPVRHSGPRPIDEAISTAGGISHAALEQNLMLTDLPGVFAAGEMLDWEAPTGGYLITACLATGRHAGLGAATYLNH